MAHRAGSADLGRFLKCAIPRDECRLAVALRGANI